MPNIPNPMDPFIPNPDGAPIPTDSERNAREPLSGYIRDQRDFTEKATADMKSRENDEFLKKSWIEPEESKPYVFEEPTIPIWKPKESVLEKYKTEPEPFLFTKPKEDIIEKYKITQEETASILPETLLRPPKKSFKNYSITSEEPIADPLADFCARQYEERERRPKKAVENMFMPIEPEIPTIPKQLTIAKLPKTEPEIPYVKSIEPLFDPASYLMQKSKEESRKSMLVTPEPQTPIIPEIPKTETKLSYYPELIERQNIPVAPIEPEPTQSNPDVFQRAVDLIKERFPAPSADPEPIYRPEPKPPKSMLDIAREAADILLNRLPKPPTTKPRKTHSNWGIFMQDMDKIEKRKKARGTNFWNEFIDQFK